MGGGRGGGLPRARALLSVGGVDVRRVRARGVRGERMRRDNMRRGGGGVGEGGGCGWRRRVTVKGVAD